MSLIKCKECGNAVSNTAEACPKCGAKVARTPIGCGSAIGIIFLAIILIIALENNNTISSTLISQSESPTPAIDLLIQCDKEAAVKIQSMLREMATWQEKDNVITFKWGTVWDEAAPHERMGLVRSFADSDACLMGHAREINFYRVGKLVAKASTSFGIQLVD